MKSATMSPSPSGRMLARTGDTPGHLALLGVSLGTNIAGLALPLALIHVYDRIIPNQAGGTALVLFSVVAIAVLAEAFLRHVRGVALARSAAWAELRMSRAAAQAALSGGLDPRQSGLTFALIARARDSLGGGLAAALYDAPFAIIFLLLVWMIAGPVVLVPIIVAAAFALLAAWVARHHAASGISSLQTAERHLRSWRAMIQAPDAIRAAGIAPAAMGRLAAQRNAAAIATEQHEAANGGLLELGQVGGLVITIGVLAVGAPIALAGGLSTGGLGAVTMLATRGGGMLIALASAVLRHGMIRRAQAELDGALAAAHAVPAAAAPPAGIMLFDGPDEAAADAALRAASAAPGAVLVPARPAMLRGSILDNLTLFDPGRSDAALALAARLGLDRIVGRLAQGYHTKVGLDGRNALPPGAVKRVALIAAILQRPAVLLLERPTVTLDAAGVEALAGLLPELPGQGIAVGMTTHAAVLRALATDGRA